MSAFVVPGKSGKRASAVVVQGGSKARRSALAEWCAAVQGAALDALGVAEAEAARFVAVPVEVAIEFRMPRPKAHYRTGKRADELRANAPRFPIGTPDTDKLVRAVLDALIGVAFDDDSRVSRLSADRVFADRGREGARVRVAALGATHLRAVAPPAIAGGTVAASYGAALDRLAATAEADGIDRDLEAAAASAPPPARRKVAPIAAAGPPPAAARIRELLGADGEAFAAERAITAPRTDVATMEAIAERDPFLAALVADRVDELTARDRCDGDHAPPTCADPHCWRGPGTPDTRAFPEPDGYRDAIARSYATEVADEDDFG